ncbi:restriction endonuclease subunit S [Finegoldia sp. P3-F-LR]
MTRKMKDSGIEWIGEIPEDWEIVKLKHLALDRQAGVWGKDESQDNLTNNKICIRIADFDYPRMTIRKDREFTLRNYTDNEISKCSLQKGDILIEKSGGGEKTPVGRTIIWNEDFQALYANFIERLRVDKKQILPMFAQFCFFAFYGIGVSNLYFNQTTGIQNLNITGMMNDLRLPTPDLSTQIKIVDILDRKRNQIEIIKSAIIKEIQTLEDYKKSLITEAVTKGLDKNVEMKDSGIEWIGEIPKHWKINKIGRICNVITDFVASGSFASIAKNVTYLNNEDYAMLVRTVDLSNKRESVNRIYINKNSYEFLRNSNLIGGEIVLPNIGASIGDVYIVPKLYKRMSLAPNSIMIKTKYVDKYYYYCFSSKYGKILLQNLSISSAQPKFNKTELRNIKMMQPPIKEQKSIVAYLDEKCKLIDDSISLKKKQLETLEEYKKSLIYEYVTGKKEVKDGEET